MNEEKMEVIINGEKRHRRVDHYDSTIFGYTAVPVLYEGETIMQMIDGTTHIVRLY